MSVSIIACPSCNTLLLPDTAQCPTCHHVLIESQPTELGAIPGAAAADSSEIEDACPGCNELVRRGLVRCWNCGTFMREEIAQSYQRMQATPSRVIYSELPEETAEDESPAETAARAAEAPAADDVDFELAPEIVPGFAEDDDFETAPSLVAQEDAIVASAPAMPEPAAAEPEEAPAKPAKEKSAEAKKKDKEKDKGAGKEAAAKSPSEDQQEFASEFESQFGVAHSVATGGDVLLQVALAEEAETGVRRRSRRGEGGGSRSGFVVYCPHGHRVEVQERHRGLTGRCPRCREPFVVPANPWDTIKADEEAKVKAAEQQLAAASLAAKTSEAEIEISAGEYTRWLPDVHHHTVNLTKLKLTPGSLLKDYQEVDLAFSPNGILKIFLVKKGGLFGGSEKKKEATRQAVVNHLTEAKDLDDLPGASHQLYNTSAVPQIRVVQPMIKGEESMFAGVPVFGEGRIGVRFPKIDDTADPQFASFCLSEFRNFSSVLDEFYGIKNFGAEYGIPLEDKFTERHCHYTEQPVVHLEHIEFYKDDPGFKLKLVGRCCQGCGLVVSEEARAKEKIGGKSGKGIAKAKCPKCEKPFGDISLFAFDEAPAEEAPAEKS